MKALCNSCGAALTCGANDPASLCWCTQKPSLLVVDDNKSCFCAECLDKQLAKQGVLQCFRLHVSYLGTKFAGFQQQDNARTVEGELKAAISKVARSTFTLDAAGRTDAGVHGRGQVVSLTMTTRLVPRQLMLALAQHLPHDMAVWRVDPMHLGFDARRQSVGKRYVYRIQHGEVADPFHRAIAYFVREKLDVDAMHDAAQVLVGHHDFSSFRASLCTAAHARRYLWQVTVRNHGSIVEIEIRGNAFCMNMVRIIAGTLVEVGRKKRVKESIIAALTTADRRLAGPTAPAHGLTLEEIYYPDNLSDANIPVDASFPRYPVTLETWPVVVHQR